MASVTGLDGGKDPPGTPMSAVKGFFRNRLKEAVEATRRVPTTPISEPPAHNTNEPRPLNVVPVQTISPEQLQFEQENPSLSYTSIEDQSENGAPQIVISPSSSVVNSIDINTALPASTISIIETPRNQDAEPTSPSAPVNTNLRFTQARSVLSIDPDGSTSGLTSLGRVVAIQERQLDSCIRDLRPDPSISITSEVSGITNVDRHSSSSPYADISLPTEWQGDLHPKTIKLLNKIPRAKQEEIICYVNRYSRSKHISNVAEVTSYAVDMIDMYYSNINDVPLTPTSSIPTINNEANVFINTETRPSIDTEIPITTPKANDDDNISIIDSVAQIVRNELKEQQHVQAGLQQDQMNINQEVLAQMKNLSKDPSLIDTKHNKWMDKLVINEKKDTFPKIPETINETTLGQWYDEIKGRLMAAPWDIDGTCILDMPHVGPIAEASEPYRIRSTTLSVILAQLLHDKDSNIVVSLRATVSMNDGVRLLDSIREFLLPLANIQILDVLTELGSCVQSNGETVESFCSRLENIFNRIAKMGYDNMDSLKMAFHQRGFLRGAYSEHESLLYLQQKIKNDDLTLKSYESALDFSKSMTRTFTNNDIYKDGKMLQLKNHQLGHARSARGPGDSTLNDTNFCLNITPPTQFDIDAIMKETNCLICRLPPSHADAHFMGKCSLLKKYGYTVKYDQTKDETRADFDKKSAQRSRSAALDADDAKKAEEKKKVDDKKSADGRVKAEAERARIATDSSPATDSKITDTQTKSNTAINAGTGNRVTDVVGGLGRFAGNISGNTWEEASVDAADAVNDVNTDGITPYFRTVITSLLSPLDQINPDGSIRKCISVARHTIGAVRSALEKQLASDEIVPDSGATSHMRRHKADFEDDYVTCNDVFVLMGDGTEIPVLGYGTSRMKVDGHISRLVNSLHVPELDCDLFSCTRHGRNGKGCSFLLEDSKMHLSFPKFHITRDIPEDGDLRLPLDVITDEDWGIPNFVCDGINDEDQHLDDFKTRMYFLNQIFKGRTMTRQQRKKELDSLKHALGGNHTRDSPPLPDQDSTPPSKLPSNATLGLPDNYLCEGSPDKMMMDALKELNINDIRDFLKDMDPNTDQFEKQKRAPPPQYHLESSRGDVKDRLTAFELQSYFGGRQLKDFSLLSTLGTGLSVIDNDQEIPTIGELVNRKRGKRRRKGSKATVPLEVVGMDIGYGDGVSVGGHKYVLVLVDQCTTNSFIYGMHGSSGADVCEALWKFFIDAGGFPKTIQCDFDPRLIGGKAAALLRTHGTRVRAAPPRRQDKNGLVERRWQSLTKMARSFLSEAKLPKKFWYWAIREANLRLNILPITQQQDGINDTSLMSTPYFEFFGVKPDYRILFPFGTIGAFRRVRDGNHDRTNFESQCLLGIALGRSEFTNGMIFYNPILDSFSTSADYLIDKNRNVGEVFPSLRYDGGLTTSVLSDRSDGPTKFMIGDKVWVQDSTTFDVMEAIVTIPPTSKTKMYTVSLVEDSTFHEVAPEHIYTDNDVPSSGKPSSSLGFFLPDWMKQDQKVTLLNDNVYKHGYLHINDKQLWEFVSRDTEGRITFRYDLSDIQYSWKMRMQENTFDIGWQESTARRVYGTGRHVSAINLNANYAPPNLKIALAGNNPDKQTWRSSYDEEYDGLDKLNVFTEITHLQYKEYRRIHGDKATAIPTMNLFTIKPDMDGNPIRAKSRIVALGNLERRIWSREDKYAPVLSSTASRLLVSMAVDDGRRLKQADCKNAFCNGILPDDEICIVKPPTGCPRSTPGTLWKLNKTLYGLTRSAHHWYTKISNHLKDDMGFESMPQDNCVYKCTPIEGQPPIYVGLYVDDLIFYSKSDKVEEWFENNLKSHLKVDFMGDAAWFLGQRYDWYTDPNNGNISCHISQQAMVEGMLERHNLEHCTTARSPYRSGIVIDRIEHDGKDISTKQKLLKDYQSLIGGLNWLSINTRPDINTAYSLLSQFNCNPSQGHMDSAKYVLRYLKHTSSHGIWFKQGENRLHGSVAIPEELKGKELMVFTDSNWGPQDASKPKPNEQRTVTMEELKSIQGFYITRMGGPLYWGVHREKRGSRSSCMAEIKSIDDGIRAIQYLRHLMKQLGLPDVDFPTPLLNDNQGSIDWIESGCKPTKKLRHENLSELGISEARDHDEVKIYWMPGASNLADLFTKEDKDVAHFEAIRDKMVMPRESFGLPSTSSSNHNTTSWGVLERRMSDRNYDKMTRLTKSEAESTMTTQYDIDVSDHQPVAVASE